MPRVLRRGWIGLLVLTTSTAIAHHSYSAFDRTKESSVEGTVKQWQWTNPHSFLLVVAKDPDGSVHEWKFESASPAILTHLAKMTRNSFRMGDKITVTYFPARDQPYYGSFNSAVFADGRKYSFGLPDYNKANSAPPGILQQPADMPDKNP